MKDLRVLGNRDLSKVSIIDNHVYSFGFQLDNGIPILPFYDDINDIQLTFLISYFKKLLKNKDCRSVHKKHFEFSQLLKCNIENFVKFYDEDEESMLQEEFDMRAIAINTQKQNSAARLSQPQYYHQNIQQQKDDSSGTSTSLSRDNLEDLGDNDNQQNDGDAGSGSVTKAATFGESNNLEENSSNNGDSEEYKDSNILKENQKNPYTKKKSFCINLYSSIVRTQSSKNQQKQQQIPKINIVTYQKDDDLTNFKSPDYLNRVPNTPKNGKHHQHQSMKNISSILQHVPAFSLSQIDDKQKKQESEKKSKAEQYKKNSHQQQQQQEKVLRQTNSQQTDCLPRLVSRVIDQKPLSKSLKKSNKKKDKVKTLLMKQNQYQQFYKEKGLQNNQSTSESQEDGSQMQKSQNSIQIGMQYISSFLQRNYNEKSVDRDVTLPRLQKSSFSSTQCFQESSKRRFSGVDDDTNLYIQGCKDQQSNQDLSCERTSAFLESFGKQQGRRVTYT